MDKWLGLGVVLFVLVLSFLARNAVAAVAAVAHRVAVARAWLNRAWLKRKKRFRKRPPRTAAANQKSLAVLAAPNGGGGKLPVRLAIRAHASVADLSFVIADFAGASWTTKIDGLFIRLGFVKLEVDNCPAAHDERRQDDPEHNIHEVEVHDVSQAIIPQSNKQDLRTPLVDHFRAGRSPPRFSPILSVPCMHFALPPKQTNSRWIRLDDIHEPA